ncbi:MAG: BamA/TamA family outer membrane protein [Chitinophagales bacterium]|nr:BamA/TamA family outer membrane protein [Chitinophagales bacterium]
MRKIKYILFFLTAAMLSFHSMAQDYSFVNKINFKGNTTLQAEDLLKQMNTKPRKLLDKVAFWNKKEEFSYFLLDEDIERLKEYYQRNGFMNPKISYSISEKNKKKKTRIDIIISIREGNAYSIGRLKYEIDSTVTKFSYWIDSLQKRFPIQTGKRFRDEDVYLAESTLERFFGGKGYPFVNITRIIELIPSERKVNIRLKIEPGGLAYFGKIILSGDSVISEKFIRKHIFIEEGQRFSAKKMEDQQEKLFDLSVFRYVTIRGLLESASNNIIPITVRVEELPRWGMQLGAGYGTEDRLRLSLILNRINFLGGGRRLIVKANRSYFNPVGVEARLIQPLSFSRSLDLIVNPFYSRERESSFTVDRLGSTFSLQKTFSRSTSAQLSYTIQRDKVDLNDNVETKPEKTDNYKSGISGGLEFDGTDDIFYPANGMKFSLNTTYVGLGFNTSIRYFRVTPSVALFKKVGERLVIAAKVKTGILQETGGSISTPIEDRYFIGGANSLRGFGRNSVSPADNNGALIGGNTMLESSIEFRVDLFSIFSAVFFMDAGNVWADSWDYKFDELLYDAGIGLRARTPVGPVRLDFATPVIEQKFKLKFYLTVGHAF